MPVPGSRQLRRSFLFTTLLLSFLENHMLLQKLAVFLELDLALDRLAVLACHVDFACFLVLDLYEVDL